MDPLHFLILFIGHIVYFNYILVLFIVLSAKSFQFQLNKLFPNSKNYLIMHPFDMTFDWTVYLEISGTFALQHKRKSKPKQT